jgi:uncharacterized RDD family membrane protein YckC
MKILAYTVGIAGGLLAWILSAIVLAVCYSVGWWIASHVEGLDTDRGTVGMMFALGFLWTSIWYRVGQQSEQLHTRICGLLGKPLM